VLGDIQTDRGNLHVDGSPHVIRLRRTTLWHFDAESGRRPPHQKRSSAGCHLIIITGSDSLGLVRGSFAGPFDL
ncbi:MAG: hypothetical protein WB347_17780, partial [Terriglobales bacterium]